MSYINKICVSPAFSDFAYQNIDIIRKKNTNPRKYLLT